MLFHPSVPNRLPILPVYSCLHSSRFTLIWFVPSLNTFNRSKSDYIYLSRTIKALGVLLGPFTRGLTVSQSMVNIIQAQNRSSYSTQGETSNSANQSTFIYLLLYHSRQPCSMPYHMAAALERDEWTL